MNKGNVVINEVMQSAFNRYFDVQMSSAINMFYKSDVCALASITEEQYDFIINNYETLVKLKHPNFPKKDK